jgi:hypothetical protein
MPLTASKAFDRTSYLTILPNKSCDHYCSNTFNGSKVNTKYQCGSSTNTSIWAIYNLNSTCQENFIYVKEIRKCLLVYRNFWSSCVSPSKVFVFDGSITWPTFLQVINRLQLSNVTVMIDIDGSIVVDNAWKCLSTSSSSDTWRTYLSYSHSSVYSSNSNARFILDHGCLRESSYSSFSHRYSFRLCVSNPVNFYSESNDDDDTSNTTFITSVNPQVKFCPTDWFDLNGRCYRMSDEKKTIAQARNSCITVPAVPLATVSKTFREQIFGNTGNLVDHEELNDAPTGRIVEYDSQWHARLGFFLLDTDPDVGMKSNDSIILTFSFVTCKTSNINESCLSIFLDQADSQTTTIIYNMFYDQALVSSDNNESIDNSNHALINEFQLIEPNENQTTSSYDTKCLLVTRTAIGEVDKPILDAKPNECSIPRHVLCESNALVVQNFQFTCLRRPLTLDVPSLISNALTYELCLSVCQELQTRLALLNIDRCYCLNGVTPKLLNIESDFLPYQSGTCGQPCPGMFTK